MTFPAFWPMLENVTILRNAIELREDYIIVGKSWRLRDHNCAHCGESYTPKRANSLYCSGKCRVAAHRAKQPTAALTVACSVCGESFEAGRAGALYCSPSCKGKAYRARRLEWQRRVLGRRPG